nr:hypothetical protein [Leptosphaeria biglobosa chrysovirus 1]
MITKTKRSDRNTINTTGIRIKQTTNMNNQSTDSKRGQRGVEPRHSARLCVTKGEVVDSMSISSTSGVWRKSREDKVRDAEVRRYRKKMVVCTVESTVWNSVEDAPSSRWIPNLYAVCIPPGQGKTTLARRFNSIDVDELVRPEMRHMYSATIGKIVSGEDMKDDVWIGEVKRSLGKMVFSTPTVVFVSEQVTASLIGAHRAGSVRLMGRAAYDCILERGSESGGITRACSELVASHNGARNYTVRSHDRVEMVVGKILNGLRIPISRPWECEVKRPCGYSETGLQYYRDMVESEIDIETLIRLEESGEIPNCCIMREMCGGTPQEWPMLEYCRVAYSVANMPLAKLAKKRRGGLKKSTLWRKLKLGEHLDARSIDSELVRSSDAFSNSVVLWWKLVGQDLNCKDEMFKMILGVQEENWGPLMDYLHCLVRVGYMGQSQINPSDGTEIVCARKLTRIRDDEKWKDGLLCDSERNLMVERILELGSNETGVCVNVGRVRGISFPDNSEGNVEVESIKEELASYCTGDASTVSSDEIPSKLLFRLMRVYECVDNGVPYTNMHLFGVSETIMRCIALDAGRGMLCSSNDMKEMIKCWCEHAATSGVGVLLSRCTLTSAISQVCNDDLESGSVGVVRLYMLCREIGDVIMCNMMRNKDFWNSVEDLRRYAKVVENGPSCAHMRWHVRTFEEGLMPCMIQSFASADGITYCGAVGMCDDKALSEVAIDNESSGSE